jgi:ferredoxin-type protein NapH
VLNCYSCPVGTVACPIGSAIAFGLVRRIPYYIIGFLGLMAVSAGRAFCGWACPFGYLQDGLYRIRTPKFKFPRAADGLKYVLLVVLVIALPVALGGGNGLTPEQRITSDKSDVVDYCGTICPAGTLEAGLPLLASDATARAQVSTRTWSKLAILGVVLGLMVFSRRSFCRGLCPLGATMSLLSGVSTFRLRTETDKCTKCMRCVRVCPTKSRLVPETAGGKEATAECVMCLDCVRSCPEAGVLSSRLGSRMLTVSQGAKDA